VRVLVTRASDDAQRTARELARRGHEAIVAPLSEIRIIENPQPDLADVQAILATSSNGIRAFASRCARRDIPLFAVGDNSAETARSAGFGHVTSANGDSSALAATVCKCLSPAEGALLHVTGRRSSKGLHVQVANAGFSCRVWELYDAVPTGVLPDHVLADFGRGTIDAVLVLSPGSGRNLVKAFKGARLEARCAQMLACSISKEAAAALADIQFGAIRIAEKPSLDAVLALLDSEIAVRQRAGFARGERA